MRSYLGKYRFCRFYRETWVYFAATYHAVQAKAISIAAECNQRTVNALDNLPGSASP
jgi:hypothetical protein